MLYVKSKDMLLTITEVEKWFIRDHDFFNIKSCVLFVLFLCAGISPLPDFNLPYLCSKSLKASGWKTAYEKMPDYPKNLRQTRPASAPLVPNKGVSLTGCEMQSEDEFMEEEARAKRIKRDGH